MALGLASKWADTKASQTKFICKTSITCHGRSDSKHISFKPERKSPSIVCVRYLKSNCKSQQLGNPVSSIVCLFSLFEDSWVFKSHQLFSFPLFGRQLPVPGARCFSLRGNVSPRHPENAEPIQSVCSCCTPANNRLVVKVSFPHFTSRKALRIHVNLLCVM